MMTRHTLPSAILVSLALLRSGAIDAQAQAAQAPPAAAPVDYSKIEITATKFGTNFYALDGNGGRMGALVGPDGVFIVDAQFPQLTDKLVAAIRKVSDGRLRLLVNTHVHGDHTGGNENFGKLGVTIMSRPLLRKRLVDSKTPAAGLPTVTYDNPVAINMNGEVIQLIPLPPAHTDGDTAVRFPAADVLMTGDVFRSVGYPNIDRANGGSLKGLLAALNTFIDSAGPSTTVVPGHGPITNRAALIAHRDMVLVMRDRVAKLIKARKTIAQVTAAKPTADHDEQVGNAAASADRFVGQLYAELGGK